MNTIEQEFESRSMLSEDKYFEIASDFYRYNRDLKVKNFKNQYFETNDYYLSNHHMVLRIRVSKKGAILTLKTENDDGHCEEISQNLSYFQHKALVESSHFPKGLIKNRLLELGLSLQSIKFMTEMRTKRTQIDFKDYNCCVDMNEYNGIKDFNIEVEATSMEESKRILDELAERYHFEITENYQVKSQRALLKK